MSATPCASARVGSQSQATALPDKTGEGGGAGRATRPFAHAPAGPAKKKTAKSLCVGYSRARRSKNAVRAGSEDSRSHVALLPLPATLKDLHRPQASRSGSRRNSRGERLPSRWSCEARPSRHSEPDLRSKTAAAGGRWHTARSANPAAHGAALRSSGRSRRDRPGHSTNTSSTPCRWSLWGLLRGAGLGPIIFSFMYTALSIHCQYYSTHLTKVLQRF